MDTSKLQASTGMMESCDGARTKESNDTPFPVSGKPGSI